MITGDTGSFGHTVLKHFLTGIISRIRIFFRNEKKYKAIPAQSARRYGERGNNDEGIPVSDSPDYGGQQG